MRFPFNPPDSENWEAKLFSLILAFGALLRFSNLGQSQLWVDEIIQLQTFSQASFRESLAEVTRIVAATPLDFMVQQLFVTIFGQSEFGARFHAALFGSLSLPLLYLIGKRFFSTQVALLGMLLFALYPLHHQYSQEGRNYALFCFLSLSCYYVLARAVGSSRPGWWILFTVVATLLLYTNYFGGVLLVSQTAFLLCLRSERIRRSLNFPLGASWLRIFLLFLLCGGAAAVSFLPWLLTTLDRTVWDSANLFSELGLWLRIVKEISGSGYPLSLLLLAFYALGLKQLLSSRQWAGASLLLAWFLLPFPIILFLDWSRQYFFPIRQLLFTTPALYLGLAVGIYHLPRFFRNQTTGQRIRLTSLLLIAALSVGTIYTHVGREQADWKGLAEYMREKVGGDDLVSAPSTWNLISYYYPEMVDRNLHIEELVEPQEASLNRPEQNIYLIESIYMTAQQSEMVNDFLSAHSVSQVHQLPGFKVHHLKEVR